MVRAPSIPSMAAGLSCVSVVRLVVSVRVLGCLVSEVRIMAVQLASPVTCSTGVVGWAN